MNKKLIFTVLLLIIAVVPIVSPVITGAMTKSAFLEQIESIPSQSGLTINNKSYEQGWFSSQAETELIIDIGIPELESLNITFIYDIKHGPVITDRDGLRLGLAYTEISTKLNNLPEDTQLLIQDIFKDYSINMTASIGLNQEIKSSLIFPKYQTEFEDVSFDFGGIEISAVGDIEMNESVGEIKMEAIKVKNDDAEVLVSASHGNFDFYKFNEYLQLGVATFIVPNVDIKSDVFNIKFNELDFLIEAKENSGKIDLLEKLSIKEIFSPIPITSASYSFELNQVNPAAFNLWNDFSNSMRDMSTQVNVSTDEDIAEPEIDEVVLRKLLSETLQEGLEFNQLIEVVAMGTDMILDLNIRYVGLADGLHLMDVEDPSMFIDTVEIDLLIEAGENAIMTSPVADMAMLYIEQGYLKQENGKLVVRGKLKNGEANVNDIPFPINDMIAMALLSQNQEQEPDVEFNQSEPMYDMEVE